MPWQRRHTANDWSYAVVGGTLLAFVTLALVLLHDQIWALVLLLVGD